MASLVRRLRRHCETKETFKKYLTNAIFREVENNIVKKNKHIQVKGGKTEIGDWYFSSNNIVKNIIIPYGITKIGTNAFANCCENLQNVVLPNTVIDFNTAVFSDCHKLKTLRFPCGITVISRGMFYACIEIDNIVIHDNITKIYKWAFACCYNLKSIVIPNSVVHIDDSAFENCKNLKSVTIPKIFNDKETLEKIFNYCFSNINFTFV